MKSAILLIFLLAITACASETTDDTQSNVNDYDNDLEVPERPSPNTYFCDDTDDGIDILTRGTVTSDQGVFTDTCQENYRLREYYCNGDNADSTVRRCAQGPCVNGACTVIEEQTNCTDSDGGSFYDIKGTAIGINNNAKTDYCDGGLLYEAYCDINDLSQFKTTDCAVCDNGVCIEKRKSNEIEGCVDTDGGSWYDVKGTTTDAIGNSETDVCLTEKLLEEFYCDSYGVVNSKTARCLCEDGVCVGEA